MVLAKTHIFSGALGECVTCNVLLPQPWDLTPGRKAPVLWLLHGVHGNYESWLKSSNIARYAERFGLAVVMPSARNSFYTDMAYGGRYYTFITQELPKTLGTLFNLSSRREDNFIAGLSMGGAGSLMLGLSRPEQYAAIGCLSAGFLTVQDVGEENAHAWALAYGDAPVEGTYKDCAANARHIVEDGLPLPRIYHACGTEDFLLPCARRTRDFFAGLPAFDYRYFEGPGAHNWDFWDVQIQRFLAFLHLPDIARQ